MAETLFVLCMQQYARYLLDSNFRNRQLLVSRELFVLDLFYDESVPFLLQKQLPNGVAFSTVNEDGKYQLDKLNAVLLVNNLGTFCNP